MPTAVISDIHANLEALEGVLADIDRRGVDRVVCLGDIVGYGPDPLPCIDLVRERCEWSLMGNHDFGVLYEPTNFNASAESAAYWTRARFDAEPDEAARRDRYDFLGQLRVRVLETPPDLRAPVLAVHGSPRRPINEYIFNHDPDRAPEKVSSIFERIDWLCFVGHTHIPGVFIIEPNGDPDFYPPAELTDRCYTITEEKAIINVGSVGQPRDNNPHASYAILHADRVEFARVEYDAHATAEKIKDIPELDDRLGLRLLEGA